MGALQALGLDACIECGCCDYVCPSQIQLTGRFIAAKTMLRRHRAETRKAGHARQRHAAREARLAAQRESEAAALERQITATENTDTLKAIMERARDKERH